MRYVNVAINLPVKNLFKQFTYALPPQFGYIGAGWRVIVPFARQTTEGFVVGEAGSDLPEPEKYKEVQAVIGTEPWFDGKPPKRKNAVLLCHNGKRHAGAGGRQ